MNGPGDPNQGYPPQGQGYPPPHVHPGHPGQGHPGQGYPPNQPYPPGYPPQRGGSNTALLVTLIVLVVAAIAGGAVLYFTGAFGGSSQGTNTVVTATPTTGTGPTTPPVTVAPPVNQPTTPPVTAGGADVATLLQLGVQQMQSQLPIRSGPATITAVSSVGTVLTMEMTINQPISDAEFAQGEASFRQNICAGQFRNAISQGASARVEVTDSVGNSHTYNVASC